MKRFPNKIKRKTNICHSDFLRVVRGRGAAETAGLAGRGEGGGGGGGAGQGHEVLLLAGEGEGLGEGDGGSAQVESLLHPAWAHPSQRARHPGQPARPHSPAGELKSKANIRKNKS